MIEVQKIPACIPITATLKKYTNNKLESVGEDLTINFYEGSGMLETGMLGAIKKVQISQTLLPTAPSLSDVLIIKDQTYKIHSVKNCNYNLAIYPFWECEVKSIKANHNAN